MTIAHNSTRIAPHELSACMRRNMTHTNTRAELYALEALKNPSFMDVSILVLHMCWPKFPAHGGSKPMGCKNLISIPTNKTRCGLQSWTVHMAWTPQKRWFMSMFSFIYSHNFQFNFLCSHCCFFLMCSHFKCLRVFQWYAGGTSMVCQCYLRAILKLPLKYP